MEAEMTDANGNIICGDDTGSGSPTATITTDVPMSCNGVRTIATSTAGLSITPGNAFYAPIDMTRDEVSISGWTFLSATTSEVVCIAHLPQDMATTPNAKLRFDWTSTSSAGIGVLDVDVRLLNVFGNGSFDVEKADFNPVLLASTTVAHRITAATTTWSATSSLRDIATSTLVAGQDLIIRLRRFGAAAADTIEGDLYMLNQLLRIDVNIN